MVVVITGGSGFIGTNLVEFYLLRGIKVYNFDISRPINPQHNDHWIRCDILDLVELKAAFERISPDYIVHLAARTDLDGTGLEDYAVNIQGTINLIEVLSSLKGLKKVLFTSSMLVCRPGYIPHNDMDFNPSTVYGRSKVQMEILIRNARFQYDWAIIRPTSIWGPWFGTPYRDFFDMVMQKRFIKISGMSCQKTYGFVLNSIFQIDKLLTSGPTRDKVFYIGDMPPLKIQEWADEIANQAGNNKPFSLPYSVFFIAAKLGDLLKFGSIKFPITTFRLKNMTTNNVVPLDNLMDITGPPPYNTKEGVSITLTWINKQFK